MMKSYYRGHSWDNGNGSSSPSTMGINRLGPKTTAVIYDHFNTLVLPQFEEFGFYKGGKDFIKDGNIELGGGYRLIQTEVSWEKHIHGMNGVAEAVMIRGPLNNQVPEGEYQQREQPYQLVAHTHTA